MAISMYSASVPIFVKTLNAMLTWLDKAQAHAEARKFDTVNYLQLRFAPDMLPFASQVRIACDNAKGCTARLGGVEIPKHEDNEATLDELGARIRKTLAFVESVPGDGFAGSGAREIVIQVRNRDPLKFDGEGYLKHFALPNFFFHATATYALLRHAGVPLGKADFLGGI